MLFVRFLSHMVFPHRDKILTFFILVKMFISYTKHLFVSILSRTFVCIFSILYFHMSLLRKQYCFLFIFILCLQRGHYKVFIICDWKSSSNSFNATSNTNLNGFTIG
uniref:Uncharacterized protein n=1 Tax=Siphoviridae sp. ctqPo10 TaxID=2827948 RepID=A0A8S5SUQ3_9CAUD|nr:MAG TPA: hypothetical protein [Siphoviridae sp. ctqPo10]